MFQNVINRQEVKRFQLPNFQNNKPIVEKSPTQQCTEYMVGWLNQHGFHAEIRNAPHGSPDPKFPNLIDISCKLLVPPVTLQVTCPKDPEKAKFLGVNAEKTNKNPSGIYIQALYYRDGTIKLVGFAHHEDMVYYQPDCAIPMEATYRVYRENLKNINELPEALMQKLNNNTIKYI